MVEAILKIIKDNFDKEIYGIKDFLFKVYVMLKKKENIKDDSLYNTIESCIEYLEKCNKENKRRYYFTSKSSNYTKYIDTEFRNALKYLYNHHTNRKNFVDGSNCSTKVYLLDKTNNQQVELTNKFDSFKTIRFVRDDSYFEYYLDNGYYLNSYKETTDSYSALLDLFNAIKETLTNYKNNNDLNMYVEYFKLYLYKKLTEEYRTKLQDDLKLSVRNNKSTASEDTEPIKLYSKFNSQSGTFKKSNAVEANVKYVKFNHSYFQDNVITFFIDKTQDIQEQDLNRFVKPSFYLDIEDSAINSYNDFFDVSHRDFLPEDITIEDINVIGSDESTEVLTTVNCKLDNYKVNSIKDSSNEAIDLGGGHLRLNQITASYRNNRINYYVVAPVEKMIVDGIVYTNRRHIDEFSNIHKNKGKHKYITKYGTLNNITTVLNDKKFNVVCGFEMPYKHKLQIQKENNKYYLTAIDDDVASKTIVNSFIEHIEVTKNDETSCVLFIEGIDENRLLLSPTKDLEEYIEGDSTIVNVVYYKI